MFDETYSTQLTFKLTKDTPFHGPTQGYVDLHRFSLIDDYPDFQGQRVIVYATLDTVARSGKDLHVKISIASLILGKDYESTADFKISAKDNVNVTVEGPDVSIQMLYSQYEN
ncbi:hypothetical protein TVAG_150660 [Trichomonas vaginalis G3]|uniref:Uncharacterized protein n=1 Tax=Trichomonas vaginalis (strain ATCC PRA-98 / G3) TaxID=412133 RepID=A2DRW8_TRIV3|nr:hypothetical protein TVAGG3_0978460 [Trichomonas vaginalis G3]EAY16915.1 hypothetical protein TVAG_150660 [Trichomonas vaginalis G3]KAI5489098.1 hypothetical protein TVAGG3_0978460 [Trichomonas vaginalis G3]|eukprot:XP_001329138.1 hypothetical protein [Trichomonas vaginalis G3]